MATSTGISVRRDTAVLSQSTLKTRCSDLLADTVPDGSFLFNFDPMDRQNEALVFLADDDGTREPEQHIEHPFMLVHWACKRVALLNQEKQELSQCVRVTLVDPDRETLCFVSTGVVLSLDIIRMLRGDGPYVPPIPVYVKSIKTGSGRRMYKLEIREDVGGKSAKKA